MWEVGGFGLARAGWLYCWLRTEYLVHVLCTLLIVCNCACMCVYSKRCKRDLRGYKALVYTAQFGFISIYLDRTVCHSTSLA